MKCIVIDDEPPGVAVLRNYCSRMPSLNLVATYTDALEGLARLPSDKPDLVFLDVRMPDISGVELARKLDRDVLIIFTTAHRDYAVEGFELNVVDYLLKPFPFDRFFTACAKAEERYNKMHADDGKLASTYDETLMFKCSYQNVHLQLNEVNYIESSNNYVKIATAGKIYMPAIPLKDMLRLLPPDRFVRVHKSFIIPVARVRSYNRETVTTDDMQISVGRMYKRNFHYRMDNYRERKQPVPTKRK